MHGKYLVKRALSFTPILEDDMADNHRLMREEEKAIRFEIKAVGILCDHWAGDGFCRKKLFDMKEKLPHFRSAVFAGQGSGSPEDVPFEFLADDYAVVYRAVKHLEKEWKGQDSTNVDSWLKAKTVSYNITESGISFIVKLPVPCSLQRLHMLAQRLTGNKRHTPSELAAIIVGMRLAKYDNEISFETVRKAIAWRKKENARKIRPNLPVLSFEKQLLTSVFFDLSSTKSKKEALIWRARILDALMADYPLIGSYYLIKVSNALDEQIYLHNYDYSEVEKLYRFAYPKGIDGPFSKLVCKL